MPITKQIQFVSSFRKLQILYCR